jgi:predicted GNAT family N-acyltransferase
MDIDVTTFEQAEAAIRSVRDAVFGEEQKVPRELDWDGIDPQCTHVLATDGNGTPIGTGRMQRDGRIGRLAVLKSCRDRGVGGKMLEALIESARSSGPESVYVHAQAHAISFYEKRGFRRTGVPFTEAGIQHVNMTRNTTMERCG